MLRRNLLLSAANAAAAMTLGTMLPQAAAAQTDVGTNAMAMMAADPRFRTWVALVERSGLAPDFRAAKPFTVFASTEAAFDRYPHVRERLLAKTSGTFPDLCEVMLFVRSHVLLGLHPVSELRAGSESLKSIVGTPVVLMNSEPLTMSWASPNGLTATATLSAAPLSASNAVVYPLDDLILMNMADPEK